jgi:drug/metabolite transporter (DMT)-like permease
MSQHITDARKGELYLFLEVFLWSLFPIITVLSFAEIPVLTSFAWSTFFSGCFFAAVMLYKGTWQEMNNIRLWKYLAWVALCIGVCFHGLYFWGLSITTPGNAALIVLFEICTSYVFFHLLRRDHIAHEHVVGSLCMVLGAGIVLAPNMSTFNYGDMLVLFATFFTPVGNFFQQRAREIASSETILFMRTLIATPFIFILAYATNMIGDVKGLLSSLPFLIVNGIVLLGLAKIFWIEATHRISVTKALALSSAGPLLTLFFAWLFLAQSPNVWQLASSIPFILGVLLLTDNIRFGIMPARTP